MNKRLAQLMKSPKHLSPIPQFIPHKATLENPAIVMYPCCAKPALKTHLGHIPMIIVSHYQGSCGPGSKQRNPQKSTDRLFLIQRMAW